MDVHWTGGDERRLRRIIATLAALAVLAERAAVRSWPVRFFVLWILRLAETVVEKFVFDATGAPPPAIVGTEAAGNGPAHALALAARLRALAAALGVLLALAWRLDQWPRRRGVLSSPIASGSGRPSRFWTRQPNDTS